MRGRQMLLHGCQRCRGAQWHFSRSASLLLGRDKPPTQWEESAKSPPPRVQGLSLAEGQRGLQGLPELYPGQGPAPSWLVPGLLCLTRPWHRPAEASKGLWGSRWGS